MEQMADIDGFMYSCVLEIFRPGGMEKTNRRIG
jgi:hypothetical protein